MARVSWVVLAICFLLVGVSAGQLVYRALQPTDGWLVHGGPFGTPDGTRLIYDMALTRGPTPMRPGDRVFAVEGYLIDPLQLDLGLGESIALARWQADLPLRYSLIRFGERITVEVTPTHWTVGAWFRYMTMDLDRAANTFAVVILAGIALLVFARRNEHPASRALLLLSSALVAQWLSGSLPDGISVILHPPIRTLTLFFTYSIYFSIIAPTVLLFALVFPQPKPWVARRPWLLLICYLPPVLILWAILETRRAELGWLCALAYVLLSIVALARSLISARDPVSRAQLHWAGVGLITGLALTLFTYVAIFGFVAEPWDALFRAGSSAGLVVTGIAMAIAVLRYRLFDVNLIFRRTLVYTVVTATMAVVYLASIVVLQIGFVSLTGQRSQAALALSTLAIAALFNPLRMRVQEWIDRRFYRSQYDANRIVAAFARIAQNEADLKLITDEMMNVIRETMQPTFTSFWLTHAEDDMERRRADLAAQRE